MSTYVRTAIKVSNWSQSKGVKSRFNAISKIIIVISEMGTIKSIIKQISHLSQNLFKYFEMMILRTWTCPTTGPGRPRGKCTCGKYVSSSCPAPLVCQLPPCPPNISITYTRLQLLVYYTHSANVQITENDHQ